MALQIHRATEDDAGIISTLIGEIEAYYGGDGQPGDIDQIRLLLFGAQPVATVLLARDGGEVLGMASYTYLWPAAGASHSLYLKELFVREDGQRQGVGKAFMGELQAIAREAGCSRIEWTADLDNPPALGFYEALGVKRHEGKVFYRVPTAP
ncbi:GNAT family N-acetyltransferase [Peterkaempfera griseoplana]|uniref:GNAT family N-acetyltransferase n=1 Tax=Peterkaempfera griseoplana TaxID=66896 RepID=UPI0007C830D6|nr:GNAT family N-acetyltransferase [Peterkaempfera griseoplana]